MCIWFNKICINEDMLLKCTPHIYIYIYIYIYMVLFGPVNPEVGIIPSGQENHSKAEHLNFPGRERNVINITEQYFL